MADLKNILTTAKSRIAPNAHYAGELFPHEAWQVLQDEPSTTLVDVRTSPEWLFAGTPDLSSLGKSVLHLSWKLFPDYDTNMQFIAQLEQLRPHKDAPLLFLCKVGGRSMAAAEAAAEAGFTQAFNITHGFEGGLNEKQHRSELNGWKADGLPWMQQ